MLFMALMALPMPASAAGNGNTLRVGPGQEYETIQAAVDAAKQGSTILVFPGTYTESVSITKNNLQIIAKGDSVIVEPPEEPAGFSVLADHVAIRGFEIAFGAGCASGISFQGSHNTFAENYLYLHATCFGINAIECRDPDGGSNFNTIERNTIDTADLGIVITANPPDVINARNVIRDNTLLNIAQTPIAVINGSGFLVSGNNIDSADFGHCISVGTLGESSIVQGHHAIVNNTMGHCAGNGISLYAYPGTVLTHNLISGNIIQTCGSDCLALEAGAGASLTHNLVLDNEASFSELCGIALSASPWDASDASVSYNLIRANTVYRNLSGICLNVGANNNWVLKNLAQDHTTDGIVVFGDRNKLTNITAHDNDRAGIEIQGDNNWIFHNTALRNRYFDLVNEGTGNRWWNNEYETANWVDK
jgi:hypothetical protein